MRGERSRGSRAEARPYINPAARRRRKLEEEFGGDVEAAAEAFDVVLVEFALAA